MSIFCLIFFLSLLFTLLLVSFYDVKIFHKTPYSHYERLPIPYRSLVFVKISDIFDYILLYNVLFHAFRKNKFDYLRFFQKNLVTLQSYLYHTYIFVL